MISPETARVLSLTRPQAFLSPLLGEFKDSSFTNSNVPVLDFQFTMITVTSILGTLVGVSALDSGHVKDVLARVTVES